MANRHHDDERHQGRRDSGGRGDAGNWRGGSRRAGQSGPSGEWDQDEYGTSRGRGGFSDRGVEHRPHRGADSSRFEEGDGGRDGFDEDPERGGRGARGARGGAYRSGRWRSDDEDLDYADRPRSPYRDDDELGTDYRGSGRGFTPMDPDEFGEVTWRGGESRHQRGERRGSRGYQGGEGYEGRGFARYRDEFERGSEGGPRYADRGETGPYGGGYSGGTRGGDWSSRGDDPRAQRGRRRDPDEGFGDTGPGQGGQGGYGGTSDYVSRSRYGGGGRGQRSYGDDAWDERQRRGGQRASFRSSHEESGSGRGRSSSSRGRSGSHAENQPRDEHGRFSSRRRSSGGRRPPGGGSPRNR